jgi:hypothetical protein
LPTSEDTPGSERQDRVLKECEEYLKESWRLRDIASLKAKGSTWTGQINPTPISMKALRKKDRRKEKSAQSANKVSKFTGIDEIEIQ